MSIDTQQVTDNLTHVDRWLAHEVPDPAEWIGKTLEVRPTTDAVIARCSAIGADGGESVGWVLPLDHGIAQAVVELQAAMAQPGEGTWLAATIDVDPGGQATLRANAVDRPLELVPGRGITAAELRAHLAAFPRDEEPWMLELLLADGASYEA